jgi:outer membrane protein TolC
LARIIAEINAKYEKIFLTIVAGCLSSMTVPAQVMTMDECMAYAVEHSISVGKQENALDNAKMNYRQSVASLFPSVSAGTSAYTNFGRSIDPETNSYSA